MEAIFAFALAYLLGSIPFGLILTRLAGTRDLREVGSGSIGATNVLRAGGKKLGAATLLLDLLKGLAAVLIAWRWFPDGISWAALGVVIGHCFPVWLKFRGGKGVATKMGVALGLGWALGLVYAAVWLGVLAATRVSSLAGMTAAISAPFAAWLLGEERFVPVLVALAVLVLWQHRANIGRLRRGEEPRVGSGAAKA